MKRLFYAVFCAILILSLCAACSSSQDMVRENPVYPEDPGNAPPPGNNEGGGGFEDNVNTNVDPDHKMPTDPNRKLIRNGELRIESLEFDESQRALNRLVSRLGGYIESSETTGASKNSRGNDTLRTADYVVRVPAEGFDDFLLGSGELGNVVNRSTSSTDVTDKYFDTEARLSTLRKELAMLEAEFNKEGPMADRIKLLDKINDVQYQIELLTGTLRKYDVLVDYATITVKIWEVVEITEGKPVEPESKNVWDRAGRSFSQGWETFGAGVGNVFVWVVGALPYLLLLAIITFCAIFFGRRSYRKYMAKQPAKPAYPPVRMPYPQQAPMPAQMPQPGPAIVGGAPPRVPPQAPQHPAQQVPPPQSPRPAPAPQPQTPPVRPQTPPPQSPPARPPK